MKALRLHEAKMEALRALEDSQGRTTPQRLVNAARAKDHVYHSSFEWNDKKAGNMHRLATARHILNTYYLTKVKTSKVQFHAPMYVRDPRVESKAQGYVSVLRVRTDEELKRGVLVAEFSAAAAALQRAYDIADVLNARDEIKEIITSLDSLKLRALNKGMSKSTSKRMSA